MVGFRRVVRIVTLLAFLGVASVACGQPAAPGAAAAYSSASALQDRGMYDLAAKEWQALLNEHPKDALAARAYYNLGVCRFQKGDFAAAAKQFDSATRANGAEKILENCWANLGLALFNNAATLPQPAAAQQAYQAAIDAFDKLLRDFPVSSQAGTAAFYRRRITGRPRQAQRRG